jgi:hypothetical protein
MNRFSDFCRVLASDFPLLLRKSESYSTGDQITQLVAIVQATERVVASRQFGEWQKKDASRAWHWILTGSRVHGALHGRLYARKAGL